MYKTLTVTEADEGSRIDAFVARVLPEVSRRLAKTLAREGHIRCAGRVVPGAHLVRAGEAVEVRLPTAQPEVATPTADVLGLTERFVYLHKPAGLHTVRLRPDDPPTLADVARGVEPACAEASPDPRECGALHRLDVSTSGVVAFARSATAWREGREAIANAWKLYLARVEQPAKTWPPPPSAHVRIHADRPRWPTGTSLDPPSQEGTRVTWPLISTGPRGRRIEADDGGSPAASRIWPLNADGAVFAIELLTGRRHQIRVHMASLGLPLEGDGLYGCAPGDAQVLLHAWAFQLEPAEPLIVAPAPGWSQS
ncbi:MAG: pseudouridine synthase [Nannocystales bacterium]